MLRSGRRHISFSYWTSNCINAPESAVSRSNNSVGISNLWPCPLAGLTAVHVFQGFRHSPRHARRSAHARVAEEKPSLVQVPESDPDSSSGLRKRKVKKRVLPEFYQSVQVTPTRKRVGTNSALTVINSSAASCLLTSIDLNVCVDPVHCIQLQPVVEWTFALPLHSFYAIKCQLDSDQRNNNVLLLGVKFSKWISKGSYQPVRQQKPLHVVLLSPLETWCPSLLSVQVHFHITLHVFICGISICSRGQKEKSHSVKLKRTFLFYFDTKKSTRTQCSFTNIAIHIYLFSNKVHKLVRKC